MGTAYGASIRASSALDLRPPNVPVALTPMVQSTTDVSVDVVRADACELRRRDVTL